MKDTVKYQKRLVWTVLILFVGFIGLAGCAAVATGGAAAGATYAYVSGWLERDYQENLNDTYQAGLKAVKDLDMQVVEKNRDLTTADIKSKMGDTDYWIKMESRTERVTKVSVRAGWLGDRTASAKIQEAIEKAL